MTDPATGYRFRYEQQKKQQLREEAYFSSEERSRSLTKGNSMNYNKI